MAATVFGNRYQSFALFGFIEHGINLGFNSHPCVDIIYGISAEPGVGEHKVKEGLKTWGIAPAAFSDMIGTFACEIAFVKVKSLESQLQSLDEGPRTETGEILDIAQAAYAEGEMSLLELLDAAEANYDAQFARRELQAEYMIGLIELEKAVGGAIEE